MSFPLPGYIQLYPTTRCNQHCAFCFNRQEGVLPDLTFKNALLLLDILSGNGINCIDIMGGEPFLLPWMAAFIREGLSRGMSLNISTNGSMPDNLSGLNGIPPDQFNIGVSLEGSTEKKHHDLTGSGNFSPAMEGIKKLLAFSLNPLVKTVLNQKTMPDIQQITDLIRGLGVKRYYIIHMDILFDSRYSLKTAFSYTEFLAFYNKIRQANPDIEVRSVNASCFDNNALPPGARCAGGTRKLSVLPDGTVFPCNLFHGIREFVVGNIFRDSLSDIWRHPRLDFFRNHTENRCCLPGCENRRSCTGGCPAHGHVHAKDLDAPDIRCVEALRRQTTDNQYR